MLVMATFLSTIQLIITYLFFHFLGWSICLIVVNFYELLIKVSCLAENEGCEP